MADDKKINLSFSTNAMELSAAKNAIRDITNELNRMVQTLNQISKGGGFGGIVSGASSGRSGSGGSSQSIKGSGGSPLGKIGGLLTEGLIADKNLFKTISDGSKDALKSMQDALKQSISAQKKEIVDLKKEIDGLGKSYNQLPKKFGVSKDAVGGMIAESGGRLATAQQRLGKMEGLLSGPSGGSGFLGGMGGALAFGGMAGVGAMLAQGLIGVVKQTISQVGVNAAANTNFALQAPALASQQAAQFGQLGAIGEQIRGGDIAKSFFMMRALTGTTMKGMNSTDVMRARQEAMHMGAGQNVLSIGDWAKRGIQATGQGLLGGINATMGGIVPGGQNLTPNELALRVASFQQDPERLQQLMDETNRQMQQSPRLSNMINQTYQGAQARLGLEAQLGAGGITRRTLTGQAIPNAGGAGGLIRRHLTTDTGEIARETVLTQATRRAAGLGISVEQLAGFNQQMAQTAGRGFIGMGGTVAGATIGGFSNAAQIFGLGTQFGGGGVGGGNALLRAAQSGMGRGGMDVTAGNQVAGLVAAGMQSGNFRGTGIEAMQGLMSAGSTGTTGGDMMQSRILQAGMTGFGTMANGSLDPLQRATNMVAARRAAPGAPQYVVDRLNMMEPLELIQYSRGKAVPNELKRLGIDNQMIKRYLGEQTSFNLSRFNIGAAAGTPLAKEVAAFRQAGSLQTFLQGTKSKSEQRAKIESLGEALRLSTQGKLTLEQSIGAITAQGAAYSDLFPELKGGGAFNPAADKLSKLSLQAQAEVTAKNEQFRTQNQGKVAMAISTAGENAEALDKLSGDLVSGAKDFSTALNLLTNAVQNSLKRLDPAGYSTMMKKNEEQAKRLNANAKNIENR